MREQRRRRSLALRARSVVRDARTHAELAEIARRCSRRESRMRTVDESRLREHRRRRERDGRARGRRALVLRFVGLCACHRAVARNAHEHRAGGVDEIKGKLTAVDGDSHARREFMRHRDKAQPAHLDHLGRGAFGGDGQRGRASIDLHADLAARLACDDDEIAVERDQRARATLEPRSVDRDVTGDELEIRPGGVAVDHDFHTLLAAADEHRWLLRRRLHFRKNRGKRARKHQRAAQRKHIHRANLGPRRRARCVDMTNRNRVDDKVRAIADELRDFTRTSFARTAGAAGAVRTVGFNQHHRRRIRLHLAQFARSARARSAPRVDHAVVHVPAVVRAEERHIDADLAREAHQRAEIRLADRRVEATPVVLDADGDHGAHDAALADSVARILEIHKLRRQRAPEARHPRKKRRLRLAHAIARELADPTRQTTTRESPSDARPDAQRDLEPRGTSLDDRAPHITRSFEDKAAWRRLVHEPWHAHHDGVEARMPQPRKFGCPGRRVDEGRVERRSDDRKARRRAAA